MQNAVSTVSKLTSEPEQIVALDESGWPISQHYRRISSQLWMLCQRNKSPYFSEIFSSHRLDRFPVGDCIAVIKAMSEYGSIKVSDGPHGSLRFVTKAGQQPDADYTLVAKRAATRCFYTDIGRDRALQFFKEVRTLYGIYRIANSNWRGLMIPTAFSFADGHVVCSEATVIRVDTAAPQFLTISGIAVEGWKPLLSISSQEIDLSGATPFKKHDDLTNSLSDLPINPHTVGRGMIFLSFISKECRKLFRSLQSEQDGIRAFIGENTDTDLYSSFLSTVKNARNIAGVTVRLLSSVLDPDMRRLALRDVHARFGLYFWFNHDDETIRRYRQQASDAFPLLTRVIQRIEADIDAGRSVVKAYSTVLGLSPQITKLLSGLHWQKVGKAPISYISTETGTPANSALFTLLNQCPPEKLPTTKRDWAQMRQLATLLTHSCGVVLPPKFAQFIFRDLQSSIQLLTNLVDAAGDTAKSLYSACVRRVSRHGNLGDVLIFVADGTEVPEITPARQRAIDLILAIAGDGLSHKKARAFSARWHLCTHLLTDLVHMIAYTRQELSSVIWKPLTTAPFSCDHGTLTFITTAEALRNEGQTMGHCVASYLPNCHTGETHIASVIGVDGTRATAEFTYFGKRIVEVRQLAGFENSDASYATTETVADFLRSIRASSSNVRFSRITKKKFKFEETRSISAKKADTLIDAYRVLFDAPFKDYSRADWIRFFNTEPS